MLSKFSVKKPYTVLVGVILVLVLGVVSFTHMTTDLLPNINLPYAIVVTTYPGASPEEVEMAVSKPVEQAMATVSNIQNIQSVSSENVSMVMLEFSQSTDMNAVSLEMREHIDQIKSYWDDSIGNPTIMKLNPSMLPVMVAAVEKEGLDSVEITEFVDDEIVSELESIEGVASVSTSGSVNQNVEVLINEDKIELMNKKVAEALGVSFSDARQELEDAEEELKDAQAEIDGGKAQLEAGQKEMSTQMAGAHNQIQSGQMEIWKTEIDLNNKLAQIEDGIKELEKSEAELLEKEQGLLQAEQAKPELTKKLAQLQEQKTQLETGIQGLETLKASGVLTQYETAKDNLQTAQDNLASAKDSANQELISQCESAVAVAQAAVDGIKAKLDAQLGVLGLTEYSETAVDATISQMNANVSLIDGGIAEIQTAMEQLPDDQTIADGKAQIAAGKQQMADAKAELTGAKQQIEAAKAQVASGKTSLEDALKQLNEKQIEATIEMASAKAQLAAGQTQLDEGKTQIEDGLKQLEEAEEDALGNANLKDKVTTEMLSNILMAQNFDMPAGYVNEDGLEYLIRVGEKFVDTQAMENLVLFDMGLDDLEPIKLSDVADVKITDNSDEVYARVNGKPAVVLTMQKQTEYSTGDVSDRIKEQFAELEQRHAGLHITNLMDQGIYIDFVVDSVLNNLVSGAILAILILFVFLKDIRPTAIVACSIPISVLGAIVLMYFSGISLNIISLSGLALGVGMLVDNSIVVIENIYRLRAEGASIRKAAVQGAKQVAGAIVASTLTTVCVFLPIVFTEGITRQLFVDMGLTIGYSLMASLVVALTLVPAMSAGLMKKEKEIKHPLLDRMGSAYEKVMPIVLKRKPIVLILSVVLLVVSMVWAMSKGTAFMPEMESTQASISLTMPEGSTFEETAEMSDEVMKRLEDIPDIIEIGAMAGGSSTSLLTGGDSNAVSMYLILSEEKELTGEQLTEAIVSRTEDLPCELAITTNSMDMSALGGSGVVVQIKGKELDTLQTIAKDVAAILENTEGLINVSDGMEDATEELRLVVDKNAASEQNLTVAQIYQQIAAQLKDSAEATTLSTSSNEYPVVIVDQSRSHVTREDVKNFVIEATDMEGNTEEIPVEELVDFEEGVGPSGINRINQSRYMSVSAEVAQGYNVGLISPEVEKEIENYDLPEGYTLELAGENETINEAMGDMLTMLALAVVFIYLIMVAQFQSLLSPFIVMFTIPLAFTGGFLGLALTGSEISVISMVGFVMLSGIIVNNGIVLVDYINQLRAEGMDKKEAIILAGKTRMRPILMTALTTILGLSTMAIGIGMGADMVQPMAVVTIGGLLYGTLLTMFVVPCIYDIFNRKNYVPHQEDLEENS